MKPKYSIGLLIFIITFVYIIFSISKADTEHPVEIDKDNQNVSISTDGNILKEESFYLYSSNGYIVVYTSDAKTIYEYTNISTDELPALLQQEIKNGKFIESKEELYGFLENYSS